MACIEEGQCSPRPLPLILPRKLFQKIDSTRQVMRSSVFSSNTLIVLGSSLFMTWFGGPLWLLITGLALLWFAYWGYACCILLSFLMNLFHFVHVTSSSNDPFILVLLVLVLAGGLAGFKTVVLDERKEQREKEEKAAFISKEEEAALISEPSSPLHTVENWPGHVVVGQNMVLKGNFEANPQEEGAVWNTDGAPVQNGAGLYKLQVYCGRFLPDLAGSDGRCGPTGGPQCRACQELQESLDIPQPLALQFYLWFKDNLVFMSLSLYICQVIPLLFALFSKLSDDKDESRGGYSSLLWNCLAVCFLPPLHFSWEHLVVKSFEVAHEELASQRVTPPVCEIRSDLPIIEGSKVVMSFQNRGNCTFQFSKPALVIFRDGLRWARAQPVEGPCGNFRWSATFELRVGTDFLVVFSPDASDADADSDHSYLVHFDVDTGTVGKQAARVHQLKRVVVAAVTFPILLLSGITHDLIPFFYYSAMGQMPPCIVPSPNSCGIPCVNSVHGYQNVTSGEILELNVANRLTLDTATNYTLHALQHLSFWEPWNFVLYQFADMQCYITLYGLFASSLLTGLLIKKLVDLVRGVNATCQKLEDLHDLLLIYRWPASSNRAEINDGKLALLTFRLAKLRQPYQHTDLYKAYNMAEYPHISSRAEHPESDSGEGLTWWFLTRAAVLADLECFVRSMAFVLLVSILIVALLIVVTVYRGVTSGLEMPLTLYAIVDGLVFGVLMLILVMSGSTINDCISEGETLVQQIIDEASTEGRNTATMKALLDYYQHRPYRLKFFGLTVDRAFVTTYGGSLGAYGVVIMVNFAREYLVPWMKALE